MVGIYLVSYYIISARVHVRLCMSVSVCLCVSESVCMKKREETPPGTCGIQKKCKEVVSLFSCVHSRDQTRVVQFILVLCCFPKLGSTQPLFLQDIFQS